MTGIVVVVSFFFTSQQPSITADQFAKLIHAQHETIQDISFTYEGELVWIGSPSLLNKPVEQFGNKFQGFDFYRNSDAAELTEVFSNTHTIPSTVFIRKKTHLKGTSETLTLSPDQKKINLGVGIVTGKGGPGGLSGANSPHALVHYWYFANMVDPAEQGYRFDGWEEIDSHPCLRVQFNTGRGRDPSDKDFQRFWIDMDRGGHPLRVETYRNGQLSGRIDAIRLREIPRNGLPPVWFPFAALLEGFEWNESFYSKPLLRETIAVVNGSVRINEGLGDVVFKIAPPGKVAAPEVTRLEREGANLSLVDQFDKTDAVPIGLTDPKSVREALERQLAVANRQAKELEAPSIERNGAWSGLVLTQTALGTAGLVILCVFFWWRGRS